MKRVDLRDGRGWRDRRGGWWAGVAGVVMAGVVGAGSVAWGGEAERAGELVERLKAEPGDGGAMVELAEILVGAGRLEGAGKLLGRASALGVEGVEGLKVECAARAAGAGREELEGALSAAEGLGEEGAMAESVARLRLGDPEGALAAAKRAAEAVARDGGSEARARRVADQLEECGRVARLFELVE